MPTANRLVLLGIGLALGTMADARPLSAQDPDAESWLTVRPLVYFSNTDGLASIGEIGATLDMEDSVLVTNWAVQAELRRRRFAMLVEGAYSSTSAEGEFKPGSVPLPFTFDLFTLEALAGYRFGSTDERAELLFLAGARYLTANLALVDSDLVDDSWVTPVVALQGRARSAAQGLSMWVRTDAGARFDRKSVAWGLRVGIDWRFFRQLGLAAQYGFKTLDQPFKFGETFGFEGTSQGWLFGLVLKL